MTLTDSCKKIIPITLINNMPKAPQIAYAIPISIVFNAYDKNKKQSPYETMALIDGNKTVNPLDNFKEVVPKVSKTIANTK